MTIPPQRYTLLTLNRYIHQFDSEYEAVKKTRRPGQVKSSKEDLLQMKITALDKEYQAGFCGFRLSQNTRQQTESFGANTP
jgi:hypothetical protein